MDKNLVERLVNELCFVEEQMMVSIIHHRRLSAALLAVLKGVKVADIRSFVERPYGREAHALFEEVDLTTSLAALSQVVDGKGEVPLAELPRLKLADLVLARGGDPRGRTHSELLAMLAPQEGAPAPEKKPASGPKRLLPPAKADPAPIRPASGPGLKKPLKPIIRRNA